MMFPSNITKDHLLKAIERIDLEGIPKNASSQFYDVLYNHKRYPPKVIVSFANIFANGTELDRNLFTGGIGTPCFQLLEKEGFKIVKKQKMINIKLYDIHGSSALENYKTLISPDKKWFYWDNKQFKKYNNGDVVFWINRKLRIALYTVINNNSIKPDFRDGRNYISDNGYEVSAAAQNKEQFETFIKFEVREFKEIEPDWNYTDPSTFQNQLMAYILFENKVKDIEKRKSKLKDLALIFNSF